MILKSGEEFYKLNRENSMLCAYWRVGMNITWLYHFHFCTFLPVFSHITFPPGLKVSGEHWISPLIRGKKNQSTGQHWRTSVHLELIKWIAEGIQIIDRSWLQRNNCCGQSCRKWNLQCWYKMHAYLCFYLIFKCDLWYKNIYQVFSTVQFSFK